MSMSLEFNWSSTWIQMARCLAKCMSAICSHSAYRSTEWNTTDIVMTKFTGPQRLLIQHISITASHPALDCTSYLTIPSLLASWLEWCKERWTNDVVHRRERPLLGKAAVVTLFYHLSIMQMCEILIRIFITFLLVEPRLVEFYLCSWYNPG